MEALERQNSRAVRPDAWGEAMTQRTGVAHVEIREAGMDQAVPEKEVWAMSLLYTV